MSRPLRVLSLATLFPSASRPNFGIFVERSVAALSAQPGVDVSVIAPVGVPPWPLRALPRYADLASLPRDEIWHDLPVRRPRWRLWPGAAAAENGQRIAAAVRDIVRDLPPFDVVDAHFFHPDAVAAKQVAAALKIPFRVIARGTDIAFWAGHPPTAPGILDAANAAAGLLAVSAAMRNQMIDRGFPADRIVVHRTGVDAVRFRPLDRTVARQSLGLGVGPVLLTVGTVNQNKGQHLVIEALREVADATYLIAGTGPDVAKLQNLAKALGLQDRVRFLGSVPHDQLPTAYSAADIVLQPSANEGLANAWVEAMACGTPVIAADIPPAHEAVDSALAGRIVARSPAAIAAAIQELLLCLPDPLALSANTHARFDWTRHGAASAAHLRQIVDDFKLNGSGGGT